MIEIRRVELEDLHQFTYLMAQAFQRGSKEGIGEPSDWPQATIWGAWDGGKLRSAVTIEHYQVYLGDKVVAPMGGIAGVACLPADRGRGYAKTLLIRSLETMRENGQYVSALFPFSWDYYRQFGWEWVGVKKEYTIPTSVLQIAPDTVMVRAASEEDFPAIRNIYEQFSKRYRGMVQRDDRMWKSVLQSRDNKYTYSYILEDETQPGGYLVYRHEDGDTTSLREFIALTPQAMKAQLGLLHRLAMQIPNVRIKAASDDTLWMHRMHWDIQTKLSPVTMGRVTDVKVAFQSWTPNPSYSGRVTFLVRDVHAPWNDGVWQAQYENGECVIEKSAETPDVEMDIQTLSQMYWGAPTAPELRSGGRIVVNNEKGFRALEELTQGPPMCLFDSF